MTPQLSESRVEPPGRTGRGRSWREDRPDYRFAYEYHVTYRDGQRKSMVRASRRRSVEKVADEINRGGNAVKIELVRVLNRAEYLEDLKAKGKYFQALMQDEEISRTMEAPAPAPATAPSPCPIPMPRSPETIEPDVRALAIRVAALAGRDMTASLNELLRQILKDSLVEQARKIVADHR